MKSFNKTRRQFLYQSLKVSAQLGITGAIVNLVNNSQAVAAKTGEALSKMPVFKSFKYTDTPDNEDYTRKEGHPSNAYCCNCTFYQGTKEKFKKGQGCTQKPKERAACQVIPPSKKHPVLATGYCTSWNKNA